MADKKMKWVVQITPISPPMVIDASGNHNGATLGKLLIDKAGIERAFTDRRSGTIHCAKYQDYVLGLRDGGVLYANQVYDMLCKHEKVEIVCYETEDN